MCIFNLGWIIPDLIFAYQDITCVTFIPEGFVINLSTWLQVDGYVRIGFTFIILVIAIVICCTAE